MCVCVLALLSSRGLKLVTLSPVIAFIVSGHYDEKLTEHCLLSYALFVI